MDTLLSITGVILSGLSFYLNMHALFSQKETKVLKEEEEEYESEESEDEDDVVTLIVLENDSTE